MFDTALQCCAGQGWAAKSSHSVAAMVACSIHDSTAVVVVVCIVYLPLHDTSSAGTCKIIISVETVRSEVFSSSLCHLFHLIWDQDRALIRFN